MGFSVKRFDAAAADDDDDYDDQGIADDVVSGSCLIVWNLCGSLLMFWVVSISIAYKFKLTISFSHF